MKTSQKNFFIDKENIRRIDTFRLVYFLLFVFAFGMTEIGRNIYRPFIYENHINDYGIADSMGNLGGIIVQIFFALAMFNSGQLKGKRIMVFLILGYIFYEVAQLILPRGVFDWKDIFGTLVGGCIGFILFILVHFIVKRNQIYYRF